jgi:uncharacterized membrane protein YjjP (DUF1212 family)
MQTKSEAKLSPSEQAADKASREQLRELEAFMVRLGAALNTVSEPVYSIQKRLQRVAAAYGVADARISAFPTSLLVSLGDGEPVALEPTTRLDGMARLDQIAALDRLIADVEQQAPAPADGLRRLEEILGLEPRFGPFTRIGGYAALALGIALILHPALRDVAAAAVLGGIVGILSLVVGKPPTLRILLPMIAAFTVSALTALAVEHHLADPGLRAMIAALVVFLPGAALTTAVMELSAGEMIAGSSRLVWAGVQLALLAFGIVAGVGAIGLPSARAFSSAEPLLGDWAPWLGVLIYAAGTFIAHSAPRGSFGGLVIVLYAAWVGQVVGDQVFGGYASGFVGALAMTPVAALVARLPGGMPARASFLPGFWLLVPAAMSLIGLTQIANGTDAADSHELLAAVGSTFAVALGVLCGTQVEQWLAGGARRLHAPQLREPV